MGKNIIVTIIFLAIMSVSCSERPGEDAGEIHPQVLELMQAVPSDALAVICRDECSDAMDMLDSTNMLRGLELGELSDAAAAVSFTYEGRLRANIAINAGRKSTDSTLAVSSLLTQAKKLGMQGRFIPAVEDRDAIILISSSESQMNAVVRHLSEGRSILEADKFLQVLEASEGSKDIIVIRNGGASRLVPQNLPLDLYSRREICNFIDSFAEWTVVLPQRDGSFRIRSVRGEPHSYFANMLESLPAERLKVESFVPDSLSFLISMAIPGEDFRNAYELQRDASVKLNSYKRKLESLKSISGKDPLKWEKELDIKEIAVVGWKGEDLLLARSSDRSDNIELSENPYRGFAGALYGRAFEIKDDSFLASYGEWHIFGSKDAVSAFLEACTSRETKQTLSRPDCHFILKCGQYSLVWDKKDFTLCNSNQ